MQVAEIPFPILEFRTHERIFGSIASAYLTGNRKGNFKSFSGR